MKTPSHLIVKLTGATRFLKLLCSRPLKLSLSPLALIVWMACLPSFANEILEFTDASGHGATGHLVLGFPLSTPQLPLAGSVFDADGPGPIPSFDLTTGTVDWVGGSITLFTLQGFTSTAEGGASAALSLFASFFPQQEYGASFFEAFSAGHGIWGPTVVALPDAAATATLLSMSLATLVLAARRSRPVVS
jgi:hypothetical protein